MSEINSALLIAALLRRAKQEEDPDAYLKTLHNSAMTAVLAGDTFVTTNALEGDSHSATRQISASLLLQLLEVCLQEREAEAALEAGTAQTSGSVRWADFSKEPCELG